MKVKCTRISFDYRYRITFYRRWGDCESHPDYCRSITYKVRPYWYKKLFIIRDKFNRIVVP